MEKPNYGKNYKIKVKTDLVLSGGKTKWYGLQIIITYQSLRETDSIVIYSKYISTSLVKITCNLHLQIITCKMCYQIWLE